MLCPKCQRGNFETNKPCPHCGFRGDAATLDELSHIQWLLNEMTGWEKFKITDEEISRLKELYTARLRRMQITLGLRLRPFTDEEAAKALIELARLETLFMKIDEWRAAGYLKSDLRDPVKTQRDHSAELRQRLEGRKSPELIRTDKSRLATLNFLLDYADLLDSNHWFITNFAKDKAIEPLLAERKELQIKLGLIPAAKPAVVAPIESVPERKPAITETASPSKPMRERFWSAVLSERTLQALIFLGIFLLFTAAISFVVWGWEKFSEITRVAIPTGFTIFFFSMGWWIRNKTNLYRSGIALSAIAALFVPIDCYITFNTYGSMKENWGIFWFSTSVICLIAYILSTLRIQSRFFGYLTGVAAGSLAMSTLEVTRGWTGLSQDWYTASVSLVAAAMIVLATRLARMDDAGRPRASVRDLEKGAGRWRVFAEPFRYMALITAGALMPLTLMMRLTTRDAATFDALHYAMTVNWFVGGFVFGWGAVYHRSRTLGVLAAISLPISVYMGQAAYFHNAHINPAWQAFGLACLTPLYLYVGKRLVDIKSDAVLRAHGRTATTWGAALMIVAGLYSLTDLRSAMPAAASHAILTFSAALAAVLWQRPRYLYGASFFAFTSLTFAMNELELTLSALSVGWISLAIGHVLLALYIGRNEKDKGSRMKSEFGNRNSEFRKTWGRFVYPLVDAAYLIAGLAILPPLVPYDGDMMVYALGNWVALSLWGAYLAYKGVAGFTVTDDLSTDAVTDSRTETDATLANVVSDEEADKRMKSDSDSDSGSKKSFMSEFLSSGAMFHWFAAVPLPLWIWATFTNLRPADYSLALALAVLAWGMVFMNHWLRFTERMCRLAWREVGIAVSVGAVIAAFNVAPHGYTPSIVLTLIGLLYFADAVSSRQSFEFYPAGLVTAWGALLFLDKLGWGTEEITFSACVLVAVYFLAGLGSERKRKQERSAITHAEQGKFLAPLYHTAHLLTLFVLVRIAMNPLAEFVDGLVASIAMNPMAEGAKWTDAMQLWGAVDLILLAFVYGFFAWGRYEEFWAHVAAWLGFGSGGLIAILYSRGQGTLAAKGAIVASLFVLAERGLNYLKRRTDIQRRMRARARMVWVLFRRPLLVTGWVASVGTIGLALVRNLVLLGGERIHQIWAAVGLTIIVALYALSARMFRMARFVWFAAFLSFIPVTIFHNIGWFTSYRPLPTEFAIAWTILAWASFLISLIVGRFTKSAYANPLKTFAHILLPFSMLWAVADTDVSLVTVGLSILLYAMSAWLRYVSDREADYKADKRITDTDLVSVLASTKFLYPTFALIPLWFVYLLDWLLPLARHEHFGLALLPFGIIGLAGGQWLERIAPRVGLKRAYGLPAYIVGYATLIVGTLLVAHIAGLLVMVLLYGALLLAVSARVFRDPIWVYLASAIGALGFAIALGEGGIRANRQGWWLIGLAADYLLIGWALRRAKLTDYASGAMSIGFALIAFGLPPSSRDQVGAMWGYGGAALLYAVSAFWLRQPLLLVPASALVVVPYAVALDRSTIPAEYIGLMLMLGAVVALALGWLADKSFGALKDFPFANPLKWAGAIADRLLNWWGMSLYGLGFGLALFAPLFNENRADLKALTLILLSLVCVWAVFRFRLRGWLFMALLTLHFAVNQFYWFMDWRSDFWLRFMPITLAMAAMGLFIEKEFNEGSPLKRMFAGWSRVFYLFLLADMFFGQLLNLGGTYESMTVTVIHALTCAAFASVWLSGELAGVSAFIGVIALLQWHFALDVKIEYMPVMLAALGLGYGIFGLGIKILKRYPARGQIAESSLLNAQWLTVWENPLSGASLLLSFSSMLLTLLFGINLASWIMRATFGLAFRSYVEFDTVWMAVWVLTLVALLYALAAAAYRRMRIGYLAVAMLLGAWYLYAFFINAWDNLRLIQWYATPVGLYLLGVAFIEWGRGNKLLARWLDYAALLLMLGSLFWQTWVFGWLFALTLLAEGIAVGFVGAGRRLRRFFYAGLMGVVLAVLGQLLNQLQNINQWLVFGGIGLAMVLLAILVERNLEAIKTWRDEVLEKWE